MKLDIPKPDRELKLREWREGTQARVVEGFHVAETGLRGLDVALKAWKAGDKEGLAGAVGVAQHSLGELVGILKQYQIPIPLPGGG